MQAEADMNRFRRKDVLADGLLNGHAAPETVKTHTRMRFGKYLILMIVLMFVALVGMAGAYADIVMYDDFESPVAKGIIDASTPFAALQYGETFGSVYREGGEYYLFTSYSSGVYVRNSTDGATWGASKAVLSHGTINAWDSSKIYCPIVWKEGRTYYMIYGGYDSLVLPRWVWQHPQMLKDHMKKTPQTPFMITRTHPTGLTKGQNRGEYRKSMRHITFG
jgi:hypothetical protein